MIRKINFSCKKINKNVKDPHDIDLIEQRKIVSKRFLNAVYEDKLILFIDETGFNNNLTLIYGKNELLGFQMFKGNIKHQDFGGFIIKILTKAITDNINDVVIYCDNARFHKVAALNELFSKVNIIYSARYSPFLNPIEELFGNWKYYFRRRNDLSLQSMSSQIVSASLRINKRSCLGFFKHSLQYHLKVKQ